MDIIPGLTGWPATIASLLGIISYGIYIKQSTKSKAEDVAKTANKEAIEAMQTHIAILKERMTEAEKENIKMHQTVETIYTALKARGIYITIEGDIVHIRDNGNSTTIRMKKEE